jgi:hypothetical protein
MDDSAPAREKTDAASAAETSKTSAGPQYAAQGKRGEVVVNVRFQPNGLVNSINNKPEHLGNQDWFDRLCRTASPYFRALSGGRGVFSIPGDTFQMIWEANLD